MHAFNTPLAIAAALVLALAACGGDSDSGAAGCSAIDVPLNGSCVDPDGSCVEYRGEADVATLSIGCGLQDGTWSTDVCPASSRGDGGCRVKSDTVLTPADSAVGAYYTTYHPDVNRSFCASMDGCWTD